MKARTRAGLMMAALSIGAAATVRLDAQEMAPAPEALSSPGVFAFAQGGVQARRGPRQRPDRDRDVITFTLDASASTNGKRDTPPDGPRSSLVAARMISDLSTRLTFWPVVTPVSWHLTGELSFRGYDDREFLSVGRSAGTGLSWGLGSKTRMSANASASYRPIYSLVLPALSASAQLADLASAQAIAAATGRPIAPTAVIDDSSGTLSASSLDFGVARSPAYVGNAGFSVTQQLTTRMSANGSLYTGGTDFKAEQNRDTREWGASAALSYGILKGVNLRLGYGRRVAGYYRATGLEEVVLDNLDVGVDLTRGFSVTKSGLTFAANTGSVITTDGRRRDFRAIGKADLSQALGRSARLSAGFERAAQILPGLLRPVMTDTVSASAGGDILNAANWLVSFAKASGTLLGGVDSASAGTAYDTYTGSASVQVPFTRRAGMYLQYMVYQHDINDGVDIIDVIARQDKRQTVRVGFSLELPLLRAMTPRRERP